MSRSSVWVLGLVVAVAAGGAWLWQASRQPEPELDEPEPAVEPAAPKPPKRGPAAAQPAREPEPAPAPVPPPQEKNDDGAKPAEPAPEEPKLSAAELLERMQVLYKAVIRRPPSQVAPDADQQVKNEATRRQQEWDAAVKELAKNSDQYLLALGDAGPDARALYIRGAAKLLAAERSEKRLAASQREEAIDSLRRYLAGTPESDPLRAEAELRLGQALVFTADVDPSRPDEAVKHLKSAIAVMRKEGRVDEAGTAAWHVMSMLSGLRRDADLRAFAEAIDAADADFGASTASIRNFAQASKIASGSALPPMPEVADVDGKPVSFVPAGGPVLVHFFQTSVPGIGMPTDGRDVAAIRALWEQHRAAGLRVIGVSLDYAMSAEDFEKRKADWKEWGKKGEPSDGSLAAGRRWAERNDLEWQWTWSGKWMNDPLGKAFGGVGGVGNAVPVPFAVLIGKDGVVRWKGGAPFAGLADEVAGAVK